MASNMNHTNGAASQTNDSYLARAEAILVQKATGATANPQDLWSALFKRAVISHALNDLLEITDKSPERFHGAVRRVLNTISHEYNIVVHGPEVHDSTPAVTFTRLHNLTVPGSYHAVKTNPECHWQAFMGTHRHLKETLKCPLELIDAPRPQAELCGIGDSEHKTGKTDVIDQLGQHLASIKSSRPDLTTVHGFHLGGGQLRLASLNACGLTAFEAFERDNAQAWVALVVLLYHSSDTRDQRLTYIPSPCRDSGRWDIHRNPNSQSLEFSVLSNDAGNALERMTWTAFVPCGQIPDPPLRDGDFERCTREVPAVGVLKVSWQRPNVPEFPAKTATGASAGAVTELGGAAADAVCNTDKRDMAALAPLQDAGDSIIGLPLTEGELLRRAHRDGWQPGLVRYHDFPQNDASIEATIDGVTHVPLTKILHLASVGEPLSRCATPRHVLEVFYDLVETHLQLHERDILHRDVSWFNVLCYPKQDPATLDGDRSVLTGIPCIEKIFGDPTGQPAVLLIDLDHSAHVDRLWKPGDKTGTERTVGTPMFIAMELSAVGDQRMDYTECPLPRPLARLVTALKAIESHTDVYREAFPDGSGTTFMDNFAKVVEMEQARQLADPQLPLYSCEHELHRAHHDMETIYWDLLWTFVRALPKHSDPNSQGTVADNLDDICGQLLRHSIGRESARQPYLRTAGNVQHFIRRFLHPRLAHFAGLLEALATYFCIPWHVYLRNGTVMIDHAHHAVRRLLLAEIVFLRTSDDGQVNLELDRTQPRNFESHDRGVDRRMNLLDEYGWGMDCEDVTQRKRKRVQGDPKTVQAGESHAKKAKVGDAEANADDATVGQVAVERTTSEPCSARGL